MKKLNQLAMLAAAAAFASTAGAQVTAADAGNTLNNWTNSGAELVWKNGTNELCWRDSSWTPATAAAACDGALAKAAAAPVAAAPAAPAPAAAAPAAPAPAPVPAAAASKVTFAADAFFDFDKAVLKAEGKAKLDEVASKVKDLNLEVIVATGHTDSVGSDAYNQKLSLRRSEAVKAYLVSKGVDQSRVYAEGKGETQPVGDNKTREGRAQNRRVEIEVVGTRAAK